jgi:hypothetical protein
VFQPFIFQKTQKNSVNVFRISEETVLERKWKPGGEKDMWAVGKEIFKTIY